MFGTIRAEVLDRLMAARIFFSAAKSISAPRCAPTAKGLVFVQLYAAYEYTVRECFGAALTAVTGHSLPTNRLSLGMQALALDPEFMSLSDLKRRTSWDKRFALLSRAGSAVQAALQGIEFPDDGSHYRPAQLDTIWKLLGITCPTVPAPLHLGRIHEVVEHRNAIAHGRSTADQVGGRFSDADIDQRIDDMQAICLHLLQAVEDHCQDPQNVCR